MNVAKMTLTSTVLAAALGLALGLMATPAQAHHCKGGHDFPGCTPGGGGAGGGGGGGTTPIMATITDDPPLSLMDDGLGPYVNQDGGVKANAGPGIFIGLRGTGQDPREVTVNVNCTNPDVDPPGPPIDEMIIGDCDLLPDGAFGDQRAKVFLAARPYAVNCPDPEPGGECLDVFSLSDGASAQMGFTVVFDEGVRLDIASAIGGTTAKNPGRCLSIMTQAERIAFLADFCDANPDDCNVTVTAMDMDSDGRNDSWDIVAANDTGLICSHRTPGEVFIIGVATGVSFTILADVE